MFGLGAKEEPFQSGKYVGHLMTASADRIPLNVRIHFETNGKVSGEDEDGKSITGTHSPGKFHVEYDGLALKGFQSPDGSLGGKWRRSGTSEPQSLFKLSIAVGYDDKMASLLSMGFDETQCKKGIELGMSVEDIAAVLSTGGALPTERAEPTAPAVDASPTTGSGEDSVQQLVSMGFSEEAVKMALSLTGGDVEKALMALTEE
eukprot:PhM_4_TR10155/c0_g1_i1/m.7821